MRSLLRDSSSIVLRRLSVGTVLAGNPLIETVGTLSYTALRLIGIVVGA